MGTHAGFAFRGSLVVLLAVLVACGGDSEPGAVESAPPPASATPKPEKPTPEPSANPCADYPPPFEASYLPEGFKPRLRKGAGLFKGAEDLYPSEGLVGHYRGPRETIHANFQTRPGPLPYEPAEPRPLTVLGRRGAIGSVEGGWSVEFVLDECDFRMDTYGISRSETVKIAKGLRKTG
jgi:hypothetical protein